METATNDSNPNLRAVPPQTLLGDTTGRPNENEGEGQGECPMLVNDLDAQVRLICKGNESREERIGQLKTLFNTYSQREEGNLQANDFFTGAFAISRGKILNPLYDEVSKRAKWGVWFEENFPGLRPRCANNWRSMANRKDCHRHVRLGEARLLKLLSLTKDLNCEDPITDFLKAAGVEYDPAWDTIPMETKSQIDAAIDKARLNKDKRVLRYFHTHVDKLAAKTAELVEDAESLKKVDVDKVKDLQQNLRDLVERIES
jgi:hypothetical protein